MNAKPRSESLDERIGPCRPWMKHEGPCPKTLRSGCPHISDHLGCLAIGTCLCACHHGWFQWPVTTVHSAPYTPVENA